MEVLKRVLYFVFDSGKWKLDFLCRGYGEPTCAWQFACTAATLRYNHTPPWQQMFNPETPRRQCACFQYFSLLICANTRFLWPAMTQTLTVNPPFGPDSCQSNNSEKKINQANHMNIFFLFEREWDVCFFCLCFSSTRWIIHFIENSRGFSNSMTSGAYGFPWKTHPII